MDDYTPNFTVYLENGELLNFLKYKFLNDPDSLTEIAKLFCVNCSESLTEMSPATAGVSLALPMSKFFRDGSPKQRAKRAKKRTVEQQEQFGKL